MRVVIAEDDALLLRGLSLILAEAGFTIAGTASDAGTLLSLVRTELPDVVITDIRMPPDATDDGLRAALQIRSAHPGIGVLVLSQFVQRRYALELLGDTPAGVGYLLKQRIADVEQFCGDVRRVAEGGTALDPEVVELMVAQPRSHALIDQLTARQRAVLALLAEGRSNRAIATRMGVSEKAVIQHASRIYTALGLAPHPDDHRRVLAVIRYLSG